MGLKKTYCKGSNLFVRHNTALDGSTDPANKENYVIGIVGATPAQDRGPSFASIVGDSTNLDSQIKALYPSTQLPSHRDHSTTIKRPTDTFSMLSTMQAKYPWYSLSSNLYYGRAEYYTTNPAVRVSTQCFRLSFYRPEGEAFDNEFDHVLFQMFTTGSPSFALSEVTSGGSSSEFSFGIRNGKAAQNIIRIGAGQFTRGVWHNFIIYAVISNNIATGRFLIFKDNKIVRTRLRSGSAGSYTYTTTLIPQVTGDPGSSPSSYTLNNTVQGSLPLQVNEGGDRNLLYYKGANLMSGQSIGQINMKWGVYKSEWTGRYRTTSQIKARLDAGDDLETAILRNANNPLGSEFIPYNLRTMNIYSSVAFGQVEAGETYEDLYLLLSDGENIDADDRAYIASEPELSWFTLNDDIVIPPTSYTLTVIATTGGNTNISSGSFVAGSSVNLVATPSTGFTFTAWRLGSIIGTVLSTNASFNYVTGASNQTIVVVFTEIVTPIPTPTGRKFFARKKNIIV